MLLIEILWVTSTAWMWAWLTLYTYQWWSGRPSSALKASASNAGLPTWCKSSSIMTAGVPQSTCVVLKHSSEAADIGEVQLWTAVEPVSVDWEHCAATLHRYWRSSRADFWSMLNVSITPRSLSDLSDLTKHTADSTGTQRHIYISRRSIEIIISIIIIANLIRRPLQVLSGAVQT